MRESLKAGSDSISIMPVHEQGIFDLSVTDDTRTPYMGQFQADDDCQFLQAATCPDCGNGMVRQGGCCFCPDCGFQTCGI